MADPDLLLLDEPTNHLDIAALEWLETALSRRTRALLVASHDRAFLDAVVTRIWELRDRRLHGFRGSTRPTWSSARPPTPASARTPSTARESIEREKELIGRYRSHRKYAKMHEHERRLEELEQTARIRAPSAATGSRCRDRAAGRRPGALRRRRGRRSKGRGRVPPDPGSPDGTPILRVERLDVTRGERIGVVGSQRRRQDDAACGRWPVQLPPSTDSCGWAPTSQPGYLAQIRDAAMPGATVLDALLATVHVEQGPARSYLARFLFRGDEVFKPVTKLSGGERSRLELALLGVSPANLLLLDEPTNHLDIPAREALESFLREAPATLIVVSHDRRLLESVCRSLWVVEAGSSGGAGRSGGAVRGRLPRVAQRGHGGLDGRGRAGPPLPDGARPVHQRPHAGRAREAGRHARQTAAGPASGPLSKDAYRRQMQRVEEDLTRLGLRKSQLELALGDRDVQANFVELRRLSSELADVDEALGQAEDAWLALSERAPR